jgi:hypothetical protein
MLLFIQLILLINGEPTIYLESTDTYIPELPWEQVEIAESDFVTIAPIEPGNSIFLHYIREFISSSDASTLISICDDRNGWKASPIRKDALHKRSLELSSEGDISANANAKQRTSSSCPLLWPTLYRALETDPNAYGDISPALLKEFNITRQITTRVAKLLKIQSSQVEPFQIVRYEHGEYYHVHHDHGSYYGTVAYEMMIMIMKMMMMMMMVKIEIKLS